MAKLEKVLADEGGIASQADLARHWGISRAAASELCKRPDFPEPTALVNGNPVWSIRRADAWRAGLPRTRPAS